MFWCSWGQADGPDWKKFGENLKELGKELGEELDEAATTVQGGPVKTTGLIAQGSGTGGSAGIVIIKDGLFYAFESEWYYRDTSDGRLQRCTGLDGKRTHYYSCFADLSLEESLAGDTGQKISCSLGQIKVKRSAMVRDSASGREKLVQLVRIPVDDSPADVAYVDFKKRKAFLENGFVAGFSSIPLRIPVFTVDYKRPVEVSAFGETSTEWQTYMTETVDLTNPDYICCTENGLSTVLRLLGKQPCRESDPWQQRVGLRLR